MTEKDTRYPICPDCGCNTLVGFTPPREGIIGTQEGYDTIGTPEYVDWNRAHLYCANDANCKYEARFVDLTTPISEARYRLNLTNLMLDNIELASKNMFMMPDAPQRPEDSPPCPICHRRLNCECYVKPRT